MNSHVSPAFRRQLARLPAEIQRQARVAYEQFEVNPFHPSLRFKQIRDTRLWSVRVGEAYRALASRRGDRVVWEWIGTHAEYDQLLQQR